MSETAGADLRKAVGMLDMRAPATAAGLVQLCIELSKAGLINHSAVERIKDVIACDLAEHAPRSMTKGSFLADVRKRLDRVFAGTNQ